MIQTVYTLAAATATQIAVTNRARGYLEVVNIGANPATLGFANTITAGQGVPLYANGGSYYFGDNPAMAPAGEVWAISTAGTTLVVVEG